MNVEVLKVMRVVTGVSGIIATSSVMSYLIGGQLSAFYAAFCLMALK